MKKIEVVDVQAKMDEVASNGLDDDMYESVLEELRELQIAYNDHIEIMEILELTDESRRVQESS